MTNTHVDYQLSQLDQLEAESIHIFREVAAEFEKPVLMFSGGKDSIVMLELARKAFAPARIPFPVMHVDTGLNFPDVLEFRDKRVAELGVELVVASVPDRPAIVVATLGAEPVAEGGYAAVGVDDDDDGAGDDVGVVDEGALVEHAAGLFADAVVGSEGVEGTMAFVQKRTPKWAQ